MNSETGWNESAREQSGAYGTWNDCLKVELPNHLQLLHVSRQPHGPTG